VKSEQLLPLLHPSSPVVWAWDPLELNVHKSSSSSSLWITAWIVAWQRDDASSKSSVFTCLSSMVMWETHCTADDMQAVGGQSGLIPFLTISCSLLKRLVHQNTVLWLEAISPNTQLQADNGCQWPTHLSSTRNKGSIFFHDIHPPMSMTAYHWLMQLSHKKGTYGTLCHYIVVNVQLPLPHNMCTFVCLGISVYTLQWVSNMYEQPCIYIMNNYRIFSNLIHTHFTVSEG
jgi:hypothetical protein